MATDDCREFAIGTAAEMQKKFGWFAENRPIIRVNTSDVPDNLRELIPYAERWAIPCDITRRDFFEKQPVEDVQALARVVGCRHTEINAWLDSTEGRWPEAGYQFMYLLKAWSDAVCAFPE